MKLSVNIFSEGRGLNGVISAGVLDTVLGAVSWTGEFLVSAVGKLAPFVVGFEGMGLASPAIDAFVLNDETGSKRAGTILICEPRCLSTLWLMRPEAGLLGTASAVDGAGALDVAGLALMIGTAEEGDARGMVGLEAGTNSAWGLSAKDCFACTSLGAPVVEVGDKGPIRKGDGDLVNFGSGSEVVFSTGNLGSSSKGADTGSDCMEARRSGAGNADNGPETDFALCSNTLGLGRGTTFRAGDSSLFFEVEVSICAILGLCWVTEDVGGGLRRTRFALVTNGNRLDESVWVRGISSEESELLPRRFADNLGSGCNAVPISGLADGAEWLFVVEISFLIFNFFFGRFSTLAAPFAEMDARSNDSSSLKDCPHDGE